jgi:DNA polymerase
MKEPSPWSKEQLARQVRQHLEGLKGAGVEWLPLGSMPAGPVVLDQIQAKTNAKPQVTQEHKGSAKRQATTSGKSLFADAGGPEPVVESKSQLSGMPLEERRRELSVLAEKVSTCRLCAELASTRTQTVFGVGQVGAELCFVGEAPGADEDAQGEPFVGAAGQLLNNIIAACKMKREEVYICNIIKCRPPGNRTPLPNEAANCRAHFERQLELVQPKFICALGSTAARYLLNTTQGIGQLRGRFHDYRGIPVICTYHPAYLLPHRSPGKKKEVWEDMKMLLAKMGRPIN